jgi:aspartate racemase
MSGFLGVLGGMGPLATADFLRKLVENTVAGRDQEHIPVLMYGDCTTPDRTASIVGRGQSPLPQLLEGIHFLDRAGAQAICIPCNSAHHWYEDMAAASGVPVLHIAQASVDEVRRKKPMARVVGVMSTLGTFETGIYRDVLHAQGYEVLAPTRGEFDSLVSPGIADVKANLVEAASRSFSVVAQSLLDRGADIIILGCTEIPLGMQRQYRADPSLYVDSNDALALAAVRFFESGAGREQLRA